MQLQERLLGLDQRRLTERRPEKLARMKNKCTFVGVPARSTWA